MLAGICATLVIVLILALSYVKSRQRIQEQPGQDTQMSSDFVGKEKCKDCHRNEYEKWQDSHHDKAMDVANEKTVLGDFNNAKFIHNNITTRFFKIEDRFFVNTIGPDGDYKDFQITHTFGFYPLQQYLVPFEGGRLQCLTIAWDDVQKNWYALPNHTDDHTDWLHWTGQGQNWNGMCAECHSRRASLNDFSHDHENIMDYMIPSLLNQDLYYSDGQISDEVYVYGSFMQSKMFLRDVKCSDCHDVHSQELKQKGNTLCLSCHRADTYDTASHHFHKKIHEDKESKGDDCIQCHMPESVYMGIDKRADHSIRIPRPDLSAAYQTPNACNAAGCHNDKSLEWTNQNMTQWYGTKKRPHFGEVFAKGRQGDQDVHEDLIFLSKDTLSPGIVRATALSLLSSYPAKKSFATLETALSDADALVRQTAISTINLLQFDKDATLIFPLLYDPVKAVRIQAALSVAAIKNLKLTHDQKEVLDSGIKEYISTMEYSSDFPSGRYNLALMYHSLGKTDKAIENYEQSIKIDNLFLKAVSLDPGSFDFLFALADHYIKKTGRTMPPWWPIK